MYLRSLTCPRGYGVLLKERKGKNMLWIEWLIMMIKAFVKNVEKEGKEMKKLVLVDVDGTLVMKTSANGDEFEGVMPFGEEYWELWNKSTIKAKGLIGGVEMVKRLKKEGYTIVVVTVRGASARGVTVKKLKEIGVYDLVDHMYFRPLVCERWYWKKEENVGKNDWRSGQKWGSDQVKDYLIPIIERKLDGKFVVALEDENHETMRKHGMIVVDAAIWGGGKEG
jgi:hypothetical protein